MRLLVYFAGLVLFVAPLGGQEKSVRPGINDPFKNPDVKEFLGKFEGESREIYAQRHAILSACKLKPGMVVADIGAGTGLFTRLFAEKVGPGGKVYAVEIAPRFIDHIEKTCQAEKLTTVQTILCTPDDAKLPAGSVDLAFICDTYHHFEYPFKTMASIRRALRPGGEIVLIDFHRIPGKSRKWTLSHVRAGQEVFVNEIRLCGFEVAEEKKFLEENYFVRFQLLPDRPPGANEPGRSFTYRKVGDVTLDLHVHYPQGWKKEDRRPAIVFFFGGGWTQGTVKQFEPQAQHFARLGLVTIRADYRVKSRHQVAPPDCVADARAAIRWVRKYASLLGIDPEKIVAAGGSAGGHLAACTAIKDEVESQPDHADISCRPNALLLYNPVLKFADTTELLKRINNDTKVAKLLSPTLHVGQDWPPALLLYGKEDRLLVQGKEYVERARKVKATAELFLAEGVGHGFFNRPPWLEKTTQQAEDWLRGLGYVKAK